MKEYVRKVLQLILGVVFEAVKPHLIKILKFLKTCIADIVIDVLVRFKDTLEKRKKDSDKSSKKNRKKDSKKK